MTLSGIVINDRQTDPVCYHPEAKSIAEITALVNTVMLIAVVFTNYQQSHVVINFSNLIQEHPELNFADWKEFHTYIERQTVDWLTRYFTQVVVPTHQQMGNGLSIRCPFATTTSTQLNIVSLDNTLGGTLELSDYDNPFTRNEYPASYGANKDLVIHNVAKANLDNSIPIVNGCAFKPELWTNPVTKTREMFARQAGRMVRYAKWNRKRTYTAGHLVIPDAQGHPDPQLYPGGEPPQGLSYCYNFGPMLIDFSPIGTIDVIDYKECSYYHVTKSTVGSKSFTRTDPMTNPHNWPRGTYRLRTNPSYQISFILPKDRDAGIPIVGLFGRLFFLDEHVEMLDTTQGLQLRITIPCELLERIVISNLQHYGQHIEDTTNVQTLLDVVVKHLFNDAPLGNGTPTDVERMVFTDFQRPFIVMLDTDYQCVINHIAPKMDVKPDKLIFPANVGGLLVNQQTREIIDYVKGDFKHDSLVMYQLQCPLNTFKDVDPHRLTHPQLGHESYVCVNESPWLRLSDFTHHLRLTDCFELIDFCFME